MYGKAAYARFSPYWLTYEQALAGLVHGSRGLEELDLEVPARCLALDLITKWVGSGLRGLDIAMGCQSGGFLNSPPHCVVLLQALRSARLPLA